MPKIDWIFCLIADMDFAGGRDIFALVEHSIQAGAGLVQLRAKSMNSRQMHDVALGLISLMRPKHIPLLINDRIDIALACGADGVHLGQKDLPLKAARRILGQQRIIGVSARSPSQAIAAEKQNADYIGSGPVFPTSSKDNTGATLGLDGIRSLREKVRIPILAVGGITARNAGQVMAAGADGVAVISAVLGSDDVYSATREIIENLISSLKTKD